MYRYLEDIAIADVAFDVETDTLEQLFIEASRALLGAQVDSIDAVLPREKIEVTLSHEQLDLLLYRFLQELVFYKDTKQWLLTAEEITISKKGNEYVLRARLAGEKLDASRHEQRSDVKAITLHQLSVQKTVTGWTARVIVDV